VDYVACQKRKIDMENQVVFVRKISKERDCKDNQHINGRITFNMILQKIEYILMVVFGFSKHGDG
jgi:hypothetical protein